MDVVNGSNAGNDKDWTDPTEQAMADFVRGAFHAAVECPTNGVVQLANLGVIPLTGQKISRLDITNIEEDLKNGEANLIAVEAGGAVGSAALFYAANKFGFGGQKTMGAAKMAEYGGLNTLKTSLLTSAKSGAISGLVWGTVFTESRGGDDPIDVLLGRAANGVQYSLAFGGAAAAAEGSRFALSQNRLLGTANQTRFLTRELPAAAMAGGAVGAGTGIVNANLESLIHEHRLATGGEMAHRAFSDGLLGMSFAAAHQTHSHYTKFGPMLPGEPSKLKWIEKTDLKDPSLQKFYQENQLPGLRQSPKVLSTESTTFDGTSPMTRDTVAHVTRFPNGRIAAASFDQKIIDTGNRASNILSDNSIAASHEKRALFVGQDVFAPELSGTKIPFGHINLVNRRLANSILESQKTGGPGPEQFIGRAVVRPSGLRRTDETLTPLDIEVRQSYGNLYGRHLDGNAFPMEVQFGQTKPNAAGKTEVILTSVEHDLLPPSKLNWKEAEVLFRGIKQGAHEVPVDNPQFIADRAEFNKQWRYYEDVPTFEISRQRPPEPTMTNLESFHRSPYSEILSRGNHGFAAGITFDANAEHLKPSD